MPADATVLAVGSSRDGTEQLDLWVEGDPAVGLVQRRFLIAVAGEPAPSRRGAYLGTATTHNGALMWHVFEECGQEQREEEPGRDGPGDGVPPD